MQKSVIATLFILAFIVQKADAIIINIDARANGPASPVQTFLLAGTYTVTPIGTVDGGAFDAWNAWGRTTCSNPNGCQRTDPTTVRGWLNTYSVLSPDITAASIDGTPIMPGVIGVPFTPDITGYTVDDGFVYPSALIALDKALSSEFTLSTSGLIGFAIPDFQRALFDNLGGMSLNIIEAVPPDLTITTETLSAVKFGEFFSQEFEAVSGEPPYTWSITNGSLPDGVTLRSDGVLSGTPPESGEFNFTVKVEDSTGDFAEKPFTLEVLVTLPPPQVRVSKTGTVAVPGRTVDYFAVVENISNVTATNVEVTEFLEPWFTFISANPIPSAITRLEDIFPDPTIGEEYDAFIKWIIPRLAPGEFRILSYQAMFDPTFPIGETVIGPLCISPEEAEGCLDILTGCILVVPFSCIGLVPGTPAYVLCILRGVGICEASYLLCMIRAQNTCGSHNQTASAPKDPNEKLVTTNQFIQPDQLLVYPIHFENIGDVEAIDVFVTDILDSNLDASTLEILTPDGASFNDATRTVRWELIGRNLQPGETDNVLISIRPLPGLPSGTEIRNSAEIQFEIFDPLVTPEVVNIIDSTPPSCVMDALPEEISTPFPISWSGTDEIGEIDTYSVFVSIDSGGFTPFLERTSETITTFNGEVDKTYEFICIAADTAGNVEVQDPIAEAVTRVISVESLTITATAQGNPAPPTATFPDTVTNGDFLISGSAGDPLVGDGFNETTTWEFDFTVDPDFPGFSTSVTLASAQLTLTLKPISTSTSEDHVNIDGLSPIPVPTQDFPIGVETTIELNLLDSYSSSDILGILTGNSNGRLPMVYADDAIVSFSQLELVVQSERP